MSRDTLYLGLTHQVHISPLRPLIFPKTSKKWVFLSVFVNRVRLPDNSGPPGGRRDSKHTQKPVRINSASIHIQYVHIYGLVFEISGNRQTDRQTDIILLI